MTTTAMMIMILEGINYWATNGGGGGGGGG